MTLRNIKFDGEGFAGRGSRVLVFAWSDALGRVVCCVSLKVGKKIHPVLRCGLRVAGHGWVRCWSMVRTV